MPPISSRVERHSTRAWQVSGTVLFKYKKLLHQLETLGEKIAKDCPTFVNSQFISKVKPSIAQQLVVKASEFETLDKEVEAARRVELSFQTPPTASKPNQSLDEWKVTPPNAFLSSK